MFETLADTPRPRGNPRCRARHLRQFDDDYWAEKDRTHSFPFEFAKAIADGGWLGIAMPVEYGGAGLGVTEASIMMQEVGPIGRRLRCVLDGAHQYFRPAFDRQAWYRRAEKAHGCRRSSTDRRAPASA